jgi:hypothetical protein
MRKPHEVKQIYSRFMDRELYENFIVSAISQLESFLFDTLRLVLMAYPQKLKINVKGLEIDRSVPLDALLGKNDLEAVLEEIVESRIVSISYNSSDNWPTLMWKTQRLRITSQSKPRAIC